MVALQEIVKDMSDGPFGSNLKSDHYTSAGVRVLRLQNIGAGHFVDEDQAFISREHFESLRKHECVPGDVVVATLGDPIIRACEVPPGVGVAINKADCMKLSLDPDVADGRFVTHYLNSPRAQAIGRSSAHGQTRKRVSLKNLRQIPVPLPPIEEQRRIAAVLDAADDLRTKRRQALAKLDTLTQAIFVDMFGEPSVAVERHEVRALIDLVDSSRPITYGILKPGDNVPGGVPYIRVVDMVDGGINRTKVKRTTSEISQQYKRSILREGDLLLSIRGHVGRLAATPRELVGANITQDTARLAIVDAEPEYVLECMRSSATQQWMKTFTKGAAVKGINLGDVKKIPIPVPPRASQLVFASRVRLVAAGRHKMLSSIGQLDTLFASLQQRAFAGEL